MKMTSKNASVKQITKEQARLYLLGHCNLKSKTLSDGEQLKLVLIVLGAEGVQTLIKNLRCIQLDSLNPIGTNQDLVVMARVDNVKRGELFKFLADGHAFEHHAKERCLLPSYAFLHYRKAAVEDGWFSTHSREKKLSPSIVEHVLKEVDEIGPCSVSDLKHHGKVTPFDWSGWKGTSNATALALEVLWIQCKVVIFRQNANSKLYHVPHKFFSQEIQDTIQNNSNNNTDSTSDTPKTKKKKKDNGWYQTHDLSEPFSRWAVLERVEACGLLSRNAGTHWSTLTQVRGSPLIDQMISEGVIEEVQIEGSNKKYLAPANFLERLFPDFDDRLRIIAPLDPLIWDRNLIQHIFGFNYVWEVYKPEEKRMYGWYVCPLLYKGEFVGRMEAKVEEDTLKISKVWTEKGKKIPEEPFKQAMERHAKNCEVENVTYPPNLFKNPNDNHNEVVIAEDETQQKEDDEEPSDTENNSNNKHKSTKKKRPSPSKSKTPKKVPKK